jgi:hypothetical protein
MNSFERDDLEWLETYFIMFDAERRPTLEQVEKSLKKLRSNFEVHGGGADSDGLFESLTLISPADMAAIDISFESGEAVSAEAKSLHRELKSMACDENEKTQIARLPKLNARLDLMHFGRVGDDAEIDESFDPGTLIVVVEALAKLTGGVGIDPQSGTLV